jgi:voltage-gated potassium channel
VTSRRDLNVITLAVRRPDGNILFNPSSGCEILAGDYLIVLGEKPGLKKLEQELTGK